MDDHDDRLRADLLAAAMPDHAALVRAMTAQGVAIPSQHALLTALHGVQTGSVTNGYQMARALGRSRPEAQRGAATAALDAASEYLGPPDRFTL
jgi:hypothetical protein